jgi:hypothetical protein
MKSLKQFKITSPAILSLSLQAKIEVVVRSFKSDILCQLVIATDDYSFIINLYSVKALNLFELLKLDYEKLRNTT